MLPYLARQSSLLKKLAPHRSFNMSSPLLAVSPSAAIQKPSKKMAKKSSPAATKADQNRVEQNKKQKKLLLILRKVPGSVLESQANIIEQPLPRFQTMLSSVPTNSFSTCDSLSSSSPSFDQKTSNEDPLNLGTPKIYRPKNGKLRGEDSIFAVSGFDPTSPSSEHQNEDAWRASVEAHEEMMRERAYNSSQDLYDEKPRGTSKTEELANAFAAQVAWYRREAAEKQRLRDFLVDDMVMDDTSKPVIIDEDMTDAFATDNGVSGFDLGEPTPMDTSESETTPAPVPAPGDLMEVGDVEMRDAEPARAVTTTARAAPFFNFGGFSTTATRRPNPSRGCQRRPAMTTTTTARTAAVPPRTASTSTLSVAVQPPPVSSRGVQRPQTSNQNPSLAAAPQGANTFNIAAHPPPNSARGCQRRPAAAAASAPQIATRSSRPLAPPAGARRAVPMNFVIGETVMEPANGTQIDSLIQAQTEEQSKRAQQAVVPKIDENACEDAKEPAVKILPPVSPQTLPSSSSREARKERDCLMKGTEDAHGEEQSNQELAVELSSWRPKTWDRNAEKVTNCRTWKKQSCPAEWKNKQDETLTPADGEYDLDLERMQRLITKIPKDNRDVNTIQSIMKPVIKCCMGRENIEVPIEAIQHVASLPKLAEAPAGSTTKTFKPVTSEGVTQKKLDAFEDDMINLQLKNPKVWEWLVGFCIQKGCSLQKLLIVETVFEENGEKIIEEDADVYDEVIGRELWSIDWQRIDDVAAEMKYQLSTNDQKFYEAADLMGISRHDFDAILEMIEFGGYFDTFADQVKQWAVCNKIEFRQIIRKAGLCEEAKLESLITVQKWLWRVAGDEHENFHVNIDTCLQFRYPHWYERYGEAEDSDDE